MASGHSTGLQLSVEWIRAANSVVPDTLLLWGSVVSFYRSLGEHRLNRRRLGLDEGERRNKLHQSS